jgi:hypothetical protein
VGPINADLFARIPETVEHIYIEFPEKPIRQATLEIDYGESIVNMVKDGGFDWVNSEIFKKHNTMSDEGKKKRDRVRTRLFWFPSDASSNYSELSKNLRGLGLEPAIFAELMAVGKDRPGDQKLSPIIAPGQIWSEYFELGNLSFWTPALYWDFRKGGRVLDLLSHEKPPTFDQLSRRTPNLRILCRLSEEKRGALS